MRVKFDVLYSGEEHTIRLCW